MTAFLSDPTFLALILVAYTILAGACIGTVIAEVTIHGWSVLHPTQLLPVRCSYRKVGGLRFLKFHRLTITLAWSKS